MSQNLSAHNEDNNMALNNLAGISLACCAQSRSYLQELWNGPLERTFETDFWSQLLERATRT